MDIALCPHHASEKGGIPVGRRPRAGLVGFLRGRDQCLEAALTAPFVPGRRAGGRRRRGPQSRPADALALASCAVELCRRARRSPGRSSPAPIGRAVRQARPGAESAPGSVPDVAAPGRPFQRSGHQGRGHNAVPLPGGNREAGQRDTGTEPDASRARLPMRPRMLARRAPKRIREVSVHFGIPSPLRGHRSTYGGREPGDDGGRRGPARHYQRHQARIDRAVRPAAPRGSRLRLLPGSARPQARQEGRDWIRQHVRSEDPNPCRLASDSGPERCGSEASGRCASRSTVRTSQHDA